MNYDDSDFGIEYPFEETTGTGDENRIRGNWSLKLDYLLSAFGYIFALGNLWRFPYQCSINGGFAFAYNLILKMIFEFSAAYLIPYIVLFLISALPILFIVCELNTNKNYLKF